MKFQIINFDKTSQKFIAYILTCISLVLLFNEITSKHIYEMVKNKLHNYEHWCDYKNKYT